MKSIVLHYLTCILWILIILNAIPAVAQCTSAPTCNELLNINTAMDIAQLDTGFYHTLENLDDLVNPSNPTNNYDDINDGGGTWVLSPATGDFFPLQRDLVTNCTTTCWQGPYLTYQQGRTDPNNAYDPGTPTDFFGGSQPYYLYSPLGLVQPTTQSIDASGSGDRFDRWAIVSAGSDNILNTGDDQTRLFGGAPTMSVISSVRVTSSTRAQSASEAQRGVVSLPPIQPLEGGDSILIRGYRFGATQNGSTVTLEGADLGVADTWNATEIEFTLPSPLPVTNANRFVPLEIDITGGDVISFEVEIRLLAADSNWRLYE